MMASTMNSESAHGSTSRRRWERRRTAEQDARSAKIISQNIHNTSTRRNDAVEGNGSAVQRIILSKRTGALWVMLAVCILWYSQFPSSSLSNNHVHHRETSIHVVSNLRKEISTQSKASTSTRNLEKDTLSSAHLFSAKEVQEAQDFVMSRKKAYETKKRLPQWPLRGVGYLYQNFNLTLAAKLAQKPAIGKNTLTIHNVHPSASSPSFDCSRLTIWVRINGPEILAGSAKAVNSNSSSECHWEFDFRLQEPGTYTMVAKVLVVNDVSADIRQESILQILGPSQIKHDNKVPVDRFPTHAGFPGFGMDPRVPASLACAEVCSRVHRCVYWSTPAWLYLQHGGCELYFQPLLTSARSATIPSSSSEGTTALPRNASYSSVALTAPFSYIFPEMQVVPSETQIFSAGTTSHGPRPDDAKHATMYHVGCGWSFWLIGVSPCLSSELDDAVYLTEDHFTLEAGTLESEKQTAEKAKKIQANSKEATSRRTKETTAEVLPLCDLDEHEASDEGRWVKFPYPYHDKCPVRYEEHPKEHYDVLRDYRIMENIPDQPGCYFRENMTALAGKCHMNGCALSRRYSWHSELQKLERFYGKWKNYNCQYFELLDTELQYCLNHRKIVDMQAIGDDEVASILNDYLQHRLRTLRFFNPEKEDTPLEETRNITIDTLGLSHWMHHGTRDMWMAAFEKKKRCAEENTVGRERYWIEQMYTSSERHPLATTDRAAVLNEDAASVFQSGKISAYGLSAAFAYDASMEDDGLRIIGPPMEAVVTKLFHYVCKDILDATLPDEESTEATEPVGTKSSSKSSRL